MVKQLVENFIEFIGPFKFSKVFILKQNFISLSSCLFKKLNSTLNYGNEKKNTNEMVGKICAEKLVFLCERDYLKTIGNYGKL